MASRQNLPKQEANLNIKFINYFHMPLIIGFGHDILCQQLVWDQVDRIEITLDFVVYSLRRMIKTYH